MNKEHEARALPFSDVIPYLKAGYAATRLSWNGKGQYIYMVEGSEVKAENLRGNAAKHRPEDKDIVTIHSHIDMVNAQHEIVVGWAASQTDMLANDWTIIV